LPPQDSYNWGYIIARFIGYALGFSLIGLAVMVLVRNTVAGIVAIFVLPMIDGIASELLRSRDIEPTKFLPFSALTRVNSVAADYVPYQNADIPGGNDLLQATVLGATAVFAVYFVGVWIVSWYLFLKRDAV
jgi:hypothetical protein